MPSRADARPQFVLRSLRSWAEPALLLVTVAALGVGALAWAVGAGRTADGCWIVGTVAAIMPALVWVITALRRGRAGVDLIAVLALLGTLAIREFVAGALIAVMLATGRTLESAAQRRATQDLRGLLERAPRTARRRTGSDIVVVALDQVAVDDVLEVGPGEIVPVDGHVNGGAAILDESALSGESALIERPVGDAVRSGAMNAGPAFEMRAGATAEQSSYAGIVRMVSEASADNAPLVRLADRYAAWFLPLSLAMSGLAWWASGSEIRAVAVLVVATPCPLLLAAPVAIVSGLSRASRLGVVIRNGVALEHLGHAHTLVLDKTGTLTAGHPAVVDVVAGPGATAADVLRVAASAEQLSPHVLAGAIVAEARARGARLSVPLDVEEIPGRGVSATVEGHRVEVGRQALPAEAPGWTRPVLGGAALDGSAVTWLTVDGVLTGAVLLRDPLRRDAHRTLHRLRSAGIDRLIMLTGDHAAPAREVATILGLDDVRAEQSPADKLACVRAERERAITVMVGDGINDAPALAAATVGVAMGSRGSTASSEAADIVLTTDRLDRLADAMEIARRSRRIAVQSAVAGMAMSLVAMGVAAGGWLPPAAGALLQEGIDVAVILNALRALRRGRRDPAELTASTGALVRRFAAEHEQLRDTLPLLREAADLLIGGTTPEAVAALRRAQEVLVDRLLPHERAEENELYPALDDPLGGEAATATMSRAHAEIERLSRRIGAHLEAIDAGQPDDQHIKDLLACLYGLHTVLQLHFVQEEENYFALVTA